MIVYIYNIGVDLYNGFNGLRHRINWTYFTVLDGLAHPLYSNKSKKLEQLKNKIDDFHKENLYISTIYPYYGPENTRYTIIGDQIISFLVNTIGLDRDDATSIKQKLLEHWQLTFGHDSTIKDKDLILNFISDF